MKALYIAWQDPETRQWHTVGRLSYEQGRYSFTYTRGALLSPHFQYLGRMQDKHKIYRSETLFPLFANRLLDESRPEYPEYLDWLDVDKNVDTMELLARSGGRRATDQLCVYPQVEPNEHGEVNLYFFSHGLRYLTQSEKDTLCRLEPGNSLRLTREDQNAYDQYAILLETRGSEKVGYCPRYLNRDLGLISKESQIRLTVEKVNPDAPLQFRLLCKATFVLPSQFNLFDSEEYQPLAHETLAA